MNTDTETSKTPRTDAFYERWNKTILEEVARGTKLSSILDRFLPAICAEQCALEQENLSLRESLNAIACWDEGVLVTPKFDEPYAAAVARAVLNKFSRQETKE